MRLGILRQYIGGSGKAGYYNMQELGLAKALANNYSIEVSIFLLVDKKLFFDVKIVEVEKNVKIIYLPAVKIGNHGIINPSFIEEYNIDILHLGSDNQLNTFRIIRWCTKNNVPVYTYIGTVESDSNSKLKKLVSKIIFSINKVYQNKITNVAKTQFLYDYLVNNGVNNMNLIPVGLDFRKLNKDDNLDKKFIRQKYSLPIDKKILLFVGRLENYKNPLYALEILSHLNERTKEYNLVMVGSGTLKEKVFEKVFDYSLEEEFKYIERIENKDIWELYSLSDVFINLNYVEIFGMSILEAMYYRCPVVAINAPGPNYIIENKKTGFLVDRFDLPLWEQTIEEAISNNVEVGVDSRKCIIEKFNWDSIAKEFYKLYNQIG